MSLPLLAVAEQSSQGRVSLTAKLAAYFKARPNVWIDGMELARVAGSYAWRSRISDVRREFGMVIENKQRRWNDGFQTYVHSFYRFSPSPVRDASEEQG